MAEPSLRRELAGILETARVPGCAVAWTRADGTGAALVHGLADADQRCPVEASTRFHLFSGTKLYTATALGLLVDRGQLGWDTPVRQHLPELPLHHDLRVWHLASHCSGLPETLRAFLAVHLADDPAPSTADALARYRISADGTPGGKARYRNAGYAVLGELITRVSGVPYTRFVEEAVLGALGSDASFDASGAPPGLATAHLARLSPMRLLLPVLLPEVRGRIVAFHTGRWLGLHPFGLDSTAIGGLVGSAAAFLPLLREMLQPGDGLLTAATKRKMLSLHATGATGVASRDGVGLGWKRGSAEGGTFWNHEGGGPGFCTETRLYPDANLGVVVLMNATQSRHRSLVCHRACERIRTSEGATHR